MNISLNGFADDNIGGCGHMCDNCCVSTNTRKSIEGKMTPWRFESGGFGRKIVRLFSSFFSLRLAFRPNISEDANRRADKKAKMNADALVDQKKKKEKTAFCESFLLL